MMPMPLMSSLPRRWTVTAVTLLAFALAGCGSTPTKTGGSVASSGGKGGGYYKDDGPDDNPPANLDLVPDAMPQLEPLASGANKPYVIFGKRYVPDTTQQAYTARGVASWYGKKFHGARTSNGEIYDMYAMTAAHPTMPLPSYARVTRVANNKTVIVRINDRGPFHSDRLIDLSYTAAHKLGILGKGSSEVIVELLMPAEIARIRAERNGEPVLAMAPAAPVAVASGASNYTGVTNTAGDGPEIEAIAMTVPVTTAPSALTVQNLKPLAILQGAAPTAGGQASSGGYGSSGSSMASNTGLSSDAPVTVPSTYRPTPVSAPLSSGIYLQLGAFSGERNAEDLISRVRAQVSGGETLRVVSGGNLHRVHLGPYADRDAALAAAQRLQAQVDVSPVIVTR